MLTVRTDPGPKASTSGIRRWPRRERFKDAGIVARGLGETWLDQGNIARAEPLLKRALTATESDAGVPRYRVAGALDSLARLYRLEDKRSMAEELWTRELEIDRATLGDDHPRQRL